MTVHHIHQPIVVSVLQLSLKHIFTAPVHCMYVNANLQTLQYVIDIDLRVACDGWYERSKIKKRGTAE